jgi:predicted Zn-ribbon and HTH transcriptional regulator
MSTRKQSVTIPRLHCNQCGWEWTPSKAEPRACPHCKRYNWNEINKIQANASKEKEPPPDAR